MATPQTEHGPNARVHPSAEALLQATGDEAVILDLASEQYFGLNSVGARLWVLLTDNPDLGHAYRQLLDEYEVEPGQLQRDLSAIVEQLAEAGLVRVESAP